MGLSKSAASAGKKTHAAKPSSSLSKFKSYAGPESREKGTKMGSPEKANSFLKKQF